MSSKIRKKSVYLLTSGNVALLPPANEVCEGYVFTGGCLSTGGGACMVAGGACMVARGMHGSWGMACMVARGHAWLPGGMHGCQGACVVKGGMRGEGGHAWQRGVCVGYDKIQRYDQ